MAQLSDGFSDVKNEEWNQLKIVNVVYTIFNIVNGIYSIFNISLCGLCCMPWNMIKMLFFKELPIPWKPFETLIPSGSEEPSARTGDFLNPCMPLIQHFSISWLSSPEVSDRQQKPAFDHSMPDQKTWQEVTDWACADDVKACWFPTRLGHTLIGALTSSVLPLLFLYGVGGV